MLGFMLRSLRIFIELLLGLIGVLALIGLGVVLRLNVSPVSSTFMTPYIESGIERIIPDSHAQIEHSLLTWDNEEQALALHAEQVVIRDSQNNPVAELPTLDFRLSLWGILFGQFFPTELMIDHPQIHLERRDDGQLYFGGLSTRSDKNDDMHSVLEHLAYQLPRLHFLRRVVITRTVIEIRNGTKVGESWSISVPDITLIRSHQNLSGHLIVDLTQKDKISTLEAHYIFDNDKGIHRLVARFDNITPASLAGGHPEIVGLGVASDFNLPLTGEMSLSFDEDLNVAAASVKFDGDAGTLNVPQFWNQPRTVKQISIEADFDRAKNDLKIPVATVDFGGPTLDVNLQGAPVADHRDGFDFTFDVHLKDWPADQLSALWPKPIVPNALEWLETHTSKGKVDAGSASFKGHLAWNDLADIQISEGHGKVEASHMAVGYIDGMPPVEDVSATADFNLSKMSVQIASGGIKNLRLVPFTLILSGLDQSDQYADIPLKLSGSVSDIMKLIDTPPLRYAQAIGLATDAVAGQAIVNVNLHFPLLKTLAIKDMDVQGSAELTGIASDKLAKGFNVTQGTLSLNVDKKGFSVKGPAFINGFSSQIDWNEKFERDAANPFRQVVIKSVIRDDQLKSLGLEAFNGTRGSWPTLLQINQYPSGKILASGDVDMTSAEVHLDQMNWRKPMGVTTDLKFNAEVSKDGDIAVKDIQLRAPQANVRGNADISDTGELESLELDPLVMGRTNASLYFSRADDDTHALRFEAYGAALDVSGLRGGKDPDRSAPQPKEYRIKVDRLYTSATGTIAHAEGFAVRDKEGWSAISLQGMIDETHKLDIRLEPKDSGREFTATCDDFGEALKGLGFSDSVHDGKVEIHGASLPDQPNMIEGTVKIGHFEVKNLPALVLLLNATSPFGFFDIITNTASFDRLKGRFRWQGDAIDLKDVEAAGTSVGMNIQGHADMNTGLVKLNGTLVPFSTVNGWLGSIPLLGDVLTGGSGGGILAVSYGIDGTLAEPKVSVNPVSLLTPGFLRNLFFGGDSDDFDTPKDRQKTEPLPLPAPQLPATINNISR